MQTAPVRSVAAMDEEECWRDGEKPYDCTWRMYARPEVRWRPDQDLNVMVMCTSYRSDERAGGPESVLLWEGTTDAGNTASVRLTGFRACMWLEVESETLRLKALENDGAWTQSAESARMLGQLRQDFEAMIAEAARNRGKRKGRAEEGDGKRRTVYINTPAELAEVEGGEAELDDYEDASEAAAMLDAPGAARRGDEEVMPARGTISDLLWDTTRKTAIYFQGDRRALMLRVQFYEPRHLPMLRDAVVERNEVGEPTNSLGLGIVRPYDANILYVKRAEVDMGLVMAGWITVPAGAPSHRLVHHPALPEEDSALPRFARGQIETEVHWRDVMCRPLEGEWAETAPLVTVNYDIEVASNTYTAEQRAARKRVRQAEFAEQFMEALAEYRREVAEAHAAQRAAEAPALSKEEELAVEAEAEAEAAQARGERARPPTVRQSKLKAEMVDRKRRARMRGMAEQYVAMEARGLSAAGLRKLADGFGVQLEAEAPPEYRPTPFPSPTRHNDVVCCIAARIMVEGRPEKTADVLLMLYDMPPLEGVDVRLYDTEEDLLMAWGALMRTTQPDIQEGYNNQGFDGPYLVRRAQYLGVGEFANDWMLRGDELVEVHTKTFNSKARGTLEFPMLRGTKGSPLYTQIVDGWLCVKGDYTLRQMRSFKLDAVAKKVLGEGKVDLPPEQITSEFERGPDGRRHLGEYNVVDVRRTAQLIEKKGYRADTIGAARMTGVGVTEQFTGGMSAKVFSVIKTYCEKPEFGLLIPYRTPREIAHAMEHAGKYKGAIVVTPKVGYHSDFVTIYDFESLYPAVCEMCNISYDTIIRPGEVAKWRGLGYNVNRVPYTGVFFISQFGPKGVKGLLPTAELSLKKLRLVFKAFVKAAIKAIGAAEAELKAMEGAVGPQADARRAELHAEIEKQVNIVRRFTGVEKGVKLVMNGTYGFTGAITSKMYLEDIAASITAAGRWALTMIIRFCHTVKEVGGVKMWANGLCPYELNNYYGDTDSVMVRGKFPDRATAWKYAKVINKALDSLFREPAQLFGMYYSSRVDHEWAAFCCWRFERSEDEPDARMQTEPEAGVEHCRWLEGAPTSLARMSGKEIAAAGFACGSIMGMACEGITACATNMERGSWLMKGPKMYCMLLEETEGARPGPKRRGMASVRRDTALIQQRLQLQLEEDLVTNGDRELAFRHTIETLRRVLLQDVTLDELEFTKMYSSPRHAYNPNSIPEAVLIVEELEREFGVKTMLGERVKYGFAQGASGKGVKKKTFARSIRAMRERGIPYDAEFYVQRMATSAAAFLAPAYFPHIEKLEKREAAMLKMILQHPDLRAKRVKIDHTSTLVDMMTAVEVRTHDETGETYTTPQAPAPPALTLRAHLDALPAPQLAWLGWLAAGEPDGAAPPFPAHLVLPHPHECAAAEALHDQWMLDRPEPPPTPPPAPEPADALPNDEDVARAAAEHADWVEDEGGEECFAVQSGTAAPVAEWLETAADGEERDAFAPREFVPLSRSGVAHLRRVAGPQRVHRYAESLARWLEEHPDDAKPYHRDLLRREGLYVKPPKAAAAPKAAKAAKPPPPRAGADLRTMFAAMAARPPPPPSPPPAPPAPPSIFTENELAARQMFGMPVPKGVPLEDAHVAPAAKKKRKMLVIDGETTRERARKKVKAYMQAHPPASPDHE